jgi:hypothetical protein
LEPLLLLVVVVVEAPLLWTTTLERMLLEVESGALLLLLERERVLRYEVVSCRRLRCSRVLLLLLWLGEARLWYNWVAGVPQRVCIRGGESGRR